jgi:C-terminal processing protease CtpA/Prc
VVVESGRTTEGVKIALVGSSRDDPMAEPPASGSLAVTLGETADPVDVVVTSVVEGSYAERAGVRVGDVVEDVDGTPVQTMGDARERMSGPVSDDVILRVRRSTLSVTLRVPREQVRR